MRDKIKNLLKTQKKLIAVIVLGTLGIVLIVLSEVIPHEKSNKESENVTSSVSSETSLENRLVDIIGKISGAGRAEVMITFESSEQYDYAKNFETDDRSDAQSRQSSSKSEYVIIDSADGDGCVTLKTYTPQVKGVIVVCDGGDNPVVKNDITNAVRAVFDIDASSITVLKMKTTEG